MPADATFTTPDGRPITGGTADLVPAFAATGAPVEGPGDPEPQTDSTDYRGNTPRSTGETHQEALSSRRRARSATVAG